MLLDFIGLKTDELSPLLCAKSGKIRILPPETNYSHIKTAGWKICRRRYISHFRGGSDNRFLSAARDPHDREAVTTGIERVNLNFLRTMAMPLTQAPGAC